MMRKAVRLGSCLAVALTVSGCQDSVTAPPVVRGTPSTTRSLASAVPQGTTLDLGRLALPSTWSSDGYLRDVVRGVIDPGDYVCPPTTEVVSWLIQEATPILTQEPAVFQLLFINLLADLIPSYEAALFQTSDTPQSFGYNGEYTRVLLKAERDVKRFWDIDPDDIQLVAAHGTVLLDVDRTARTYQLLFGLDAATARAIAELVRDVILQSQTLEGGNHPLFAFNAFAFPGGLTGQKIVMGDGVLAGFEAVGLADVAPTAIYAHEYAHHVQFQKDYFSDPFATTGSEAEQTRYTELMADAMAAYYLTHKRGATMNAKRVEQFLQLYFQLGDCNFASSGHHGTPNQRLAATRFGFALADQAQKQGHILTADQFHALFVAVYPQLIAPDAP